MKILLSFFLLAVFLCALSGNADTILYKDGRSVHAVVTGESERYVTVELYDQIVDIPRGLILTIEKSTAEENARLKDSWGELDTQYKRESRESAEKAKTRKAPARIVPRSKPSLPRWTEPPVKREPLPREPVSETAVEPPSPIATGKPHTPMSQASPKSRSEHHEKFLWMQEVRKAIHEKRVMKGMTEKEVCSAWGWPDRTNPVHGIDKDTDRWTYRRDGEGLVDLFFENGILVQIIK